MEFLFLESADCAFSAEIISAFSKHLSTNKVSWVNDAAIVAALKTKKPIETILVVPNSFADNAELSPPLKEFQTLGNILWVNHTAIDSSSINLKDLNNESIAKILAQAFNENRSIGIKFFLEKGTKIYSESLFDTGVLGAKLDPCHKLARKRLGAAPALKAWAAVEAVILAAFQNLPGHGSGTTGDRVDLQIGSDEATLAIGIRFDQNNETLTPLFADPGMQVARDQSHLLEVRELKDAKKIEVNLIFFRAQAPSSPIRIVHFTTNTALEKAEDAAAYGFSPMGALGSEGEAEPVKKIKGGFKKKFSEQVKVISADKAKPEETTTIKGSEPEAELVRKVKGPEITDPKLKELLQPIIIKGPKDENAKYLESKIIGLQAALMEREGVVQRLSKEIEEIKDPSKMGIISNIKDNKNEALADRIEILKKELAASDKREKEFMSLADKAVQMRDEAIKKVKDLEVKARTASGGNNSKVVMLERQLEEAARQRKEMSARITQLMEQLKGKAA